MNRNKTFSISGLVLAAVAGVLPWVAVIFAPVWPVMVVCAVCTVLAVLSIVRSVSDCKCRNRALEEQILRLQSVLETEEETFDTAEDGLERLTVAASAQQACRTNVQRTNDLFMHEWYGKMRELLAEADLRTGQLAKENENYYPLRKLAHNLRGMTEDIRQAMDCSEDYTVEYDMRYVRSAALDRLVNGMLLQAVPAIQHRSIHVERNVQRMKVQTDPVLLSRILTELMDNAIQHTPENGTIKVAVLENNGMAELTIENPCGMTPVDVARAFGRGVSADAEMPCRAGMGLYLVRSYCHLLGHTVELRSESGESTKVVLRLRQTPEAKPETTTEPDAPAETGAPVQTESSEAPAEAEN
ncbi:MAG: sensor histidine kinase [Clostridia bacterium]|nr:sensor histidine kinase [Clostridia bacterium]